MVRFVWDRNNRLRTMFPEKEPEKLGMDVSFLVVPGRRIKVRFCCAEAPYLAAGISHSDLTITYTRRR